MGAIGSAVIAGESHGHHGADSPLAVDGDHAVSDAANRENRRLRRDNNRCELCSNLKHSEITDGEGGIGDVCWGAASLARACSAASRRCCAISARFAVCALGIRFYMYERAAGQLRPFHCYVGMLDSDDGVHFTHVSDQPVFTPEMAGSVYGSVQDPRVAKIEGRYYMTYAFRPYAWNSNPTGVGVPHSTEPTFPGFSGKPEENMTRSGIAVSDDRVHWRHLCWATPQEIDDRDVILFPEKINGRFALLRRPLQFVGPQYGTDYPSIWICFSEDLEHWSEPQLVIKPEFAWEDNRIGGASPPIRTEQGWLVLYHGVENVAPDIRRVCYRLGAIMLDLDDPTKVIARPDHFLMEPETSNTTRTKRGEGSG